MHATPFTGSFVAVIFALGATLAAAQDVRTFADLGLALNLDDHVRVVDRDGVRHTGTVKSLPPDALVVAGSDGLHRFTADSTAAVERRGDPVWTGAVVGFVPGFVMGVLFVSGFSDHEEAFTTYLTAGGIVGLGGAGLGALVDTLHQGHRTIYVAETKTALTVAPIVGHGRLGAGAALRW